MAVIPEAAAADEMSVSINSAAREIVSGLVVLLSVGAFIFVHWVLGDMGDIYGTR